MNILYLIIKYIHIFAAITAVGANITYGVWDARSQSDRAHLGFALRGIKFIEDRIANPAYGVVFVTGLIMIFLGHWGLRFWTVSAVVLFIVLAAVVGAVYSPLLNRMISDVDAGQTDSLEFQGLMRRNRIVGPALGLIVALILVLMVFKPGP